MAPARRLGRAVFSVEVLVLGFDLWTFAVVRLFAARNQLRVARAFLGPAAGLPASVDIGAVFDRQSVKVGGWPTFDQEVPRNGREPAAWRRGRARLSRDAARLGYG